ncbi:DUF4326 domain-containing protein [Belnapia moabensis]|uniref:DUF4326 domain-containing protein n=1 Tax=Belnapia moabensis TaxID=365533 RepID=UPI000694F8D7|nr:DUF4326 domain-containing protein [Belnapia moabensis]
MSTQLDLFSGLASSPAPAGPRVLNLKGRRLTPDTLPPNAVYIGRRVQFQPWPNSKWANPFKVGRDGTRAEVITKHEQWLCNQPELLAALPELRGKDLYCWCHPEPCHGDVLLRLANA